MHYNTFTIASLLATGAFAAAIPAEKLQKRETVIASFDPNGNTKVHLSDRKMNFGTLNPLDIIQTLYDNCYDDGICNPGPYTVATSLPSSAGSGLDNVELTVTLQGNFVSWVKNGLVEALTSAASQDGAITSSVTKVPVNAICATPPACPPIQTEDVTQYEFASAIGISYQNPGETNPSYINMSFELESEEGDGACATIAAVGSAVAGAVNGAAGGVFSLIGLFCD